MKLERRDFGIYLVIDQETGDDILVQTDWDFPGLASAFGWVPCRKCRFTDGTIDCAHQTAGEIIEEAREFLDEHIGETAEDPGYFI